MTLSLAVRAFALVTLANLLLHLPASSGKNPRLGGVGMQRSGPRARGRCGG